MVLWEKGPAQHHRRGGKTWLSLWESCRRLRGCTIVRDDTPSAQQPQGGYGTGGEKTELLGSSVWGFSVFPGCQILADHQGHPEDNGVVELPQIQTGELPDFFNIKPKNRAAPNPCGSEIGRGNQRVSLLDRYLRTISATLNPMAGSN